jgi:RNase P protein component
MPLYQGWDIVCIARPSAAMADYPGLKQAIEELMGRARLLEHK